MQAHTTLSSFEPLQRLLFYDDFNDGVSGWGALIGNYEIASTPCCRSTWTCARRC